MKKMKKMTSLLLAFVLALSMVSTAFAAEDGFTIKLTGTDAAPTADHTYTVYQIFTGDLHGSVLSNVEYGVSYGEEGEEVPDSVLEAITDADAFAKALKESDLVAAYGQLNQANDWTLTGVPAGYYLIKDTTATLPDGHERSRYIVKVVGDVDIAPKAGVLSVVKKVDDKNDTTGLEDEIVWHDSADHDILDMVDFKITTTLPEDLLEYEEYELILHDTESEGLTFDASTVKVYVDDNLITTGYEVVQGEGKDHNTCTFEVKFADITALTGIQNGSVIDVKYQSQLNENAVIGSLGNPNTVYGEYSNSYYPNDNGRTPNDTVIVFTYKVNVDKVTKAGDPLEGAEFTLYKEVPQGTANAVKGSVIKEGFANNVKANAIDDDKYYIIITKTQAESDGDTFGFKGIDDGTYVLVETTIPDGYNAWDAEEFTVTAAHDEESDAPKLTELTGGDLLTGLVDTEGAYTGVLDADIENNEGATLPTTGGMGTTLFYVIGTILVIGAGVLLITKKRMNEK